MYVDIKYSEDDLPMIAVIYLMNIYINIYQPFRGTGNGDVSI
jgi:hypothetical protein